jgi:hypothetical protein
VVMNRKQKDLEEDLKAKGYPMLSDEVEVDTDEDREPGVVKVEVLDYNYLIKMPIQQLTFEKKQALEKEAHNLDMQIKELKVKPITHIWLEELAKVEEEWNLFKYNIDTLYMEDVMPIVPKKKKK